MGTSITAALTALFNAITSGFGFFSKRQDLKNQAPIVQAKENAQEQAEQDKTNQAIANKDTNEVRNEIAE